MKKRMFGGLAIYLNGLMVAVLMEDPELKQYKNKKFEFPLWNGILIPTEKLYRPELMKELPGAFPHPVLGKWVYLPLTDGEYENSSERIVQ